MNSEFEKATRLVRAANFRVGAEWAAAHEIAQAHEGERLFDALHAFLHRIEGDNANAAYWDRRAGTHFGGKGHEAELDALVDLAASA